MEKDVVMISLFAALIAVLGLIPNLTLPFGVAITAQSMGVMLCGTILGSRRGALAVLLFLLLVAIGLPLLPGGRGGIGVFVAPSAGFLIGWPVAAFVIGLIVEKWRSASVAIASGVASVVGGIVVLYCFGIAGLMLVLGKGLVESAMLSLAFIPGDLVKVVVTALLTGALARSRPASILSRAASGA